MGVPITGYSLGIGKEHIDFAEAALQNRKLMMRPLTDGNVLASIAGWLMCSVDGVGLTHHKKYGACFIRRTVPTM